MTYARLAAMLYDALKNKPCGCIREWQRDAHAVTVTCHGCLAIAAYKRFTKTEDVNDGG